MTQPPGPGPLGALGELRARIAGGVLPAARLTRPDDWAENTGDLRLPHPELKDLLGRLYKVRAGAPVVAETAAALDGLTAWLGTRRDVLLAVLFTADDALDRAPELAGQAKPDLFDHWLGLCWLAEAAWRAVSAPPNTQPDAGPGLGAADRDLLYPLAARLRFLALSEPMRHRSAGPGSPWTPRHYLPYGLPGRVFGTGSWNALVGHCRQARRSWLDCLNDYQSHPFLATARPGELEVELTALAFAGRRGGRPLGLSVRPISAPAGLNAEDRAIVADAVDRHLLPRLRLGKVVAVACYDDSKLERRGRTALAVAVTSAALVAVALAALLYIPAAVWAAVGAYTLIGLGALVCGPGWITPWLLRLPAAAAVGLLVLLTLPEDWWRGGTPQARVWTAALVLTLASCGYLVVEARNHGVSGLAALARSLAVIAVGLVHAILVSLIGLVAVAPAFVAKGTGLAAVWAARASYSHQGSIILLASSWCLAVGVFSQILWDDRPITAPLAHLRWRSGR